jgi:prepilin-type N-terminal cleavage/methylation domain-containing protein
MKLQPLKAKGRPGFTLVEILIVIGIIAILVAMLMAGVSSVRTSVKVAQTTNDMSQLSVGLQAFKTQFGFYPPSRIRLCEAWTKYNVTTSQLDADSVFYLAQMAPRIVDTWSSAGGYMDWNQNLTFDASFDVTLEGDECLVFFLGGFAQSSGGTFGMQGFSSDITNPCKIGGTRKGPFYEFSSKRLKDLKGFGFPSYLDPYGSQPFAYFSSYKSANGYNRYGTSDCSSLGVSPYFEATGTPNRYMRPTDFQIISAGKDGQFGGGGLWNQSNLPGPPGYDDLSNFYPKLLGLPTQ